MKVTVHWKSNSIPNEHIKIELDGSHDVVRTLSDKIREHMENAPGWHEE